MLVYITFALFSTWKFMFTPLAGPAAGLSFYETLFSCLSGGYLSASLFYFSSNYFMNLHQQRKIRRMKKVIKLSKKHTKTNKTIILIKHKLGKWFICWLVPLFLSLPLGSIIVAKFYRHQKNTFLLILLGVTINGTIITGGTYLFYNLIQST